MLQWDGLFPLVLILPLQVCSKQPLIVNIVLILPLQSPWSSVTQGPLILRVFNTVVSTSLGTPPRSGPCLMPFALLPSPFPACTASPPPYVERSLTAPPVRSTRPPYRSSGALFTYAVSTSRRSLPPPTLFLPVPPRGLLPLLSAPLPVSAGSRTFPTCHYLAPPSLRRCLTPPHLLEAALCLVPFISPSGISPPPSPPDLGLAVGAQRLPPVWVIRPSV